MYRFARPLFLLSRENDILNIDRSECPRVPFQWRHEVCGRVAMFRVAPKARPVIKIFRCFGTPPPPPRRYFSKCWSPDERQYAGRRGASSAASIRAALYRDAGRRGAGRAH
jgi:hypothetical protein